MSMVNKNDLPNLINDSPNLIKFKHLYEVNKDEYLFMSSVYL